MADGAIVISTELDNKQLEKELASLSKKIEGLENRLERKQRERTPLVEESRQLAANLDAAKATLDNMQSGTKFYNSSEIKEQETIVRQMQKEWDGIQGKVETYDRDIANITGELDRQKEKAGGIARGLAEASNNSSLMGDAVDRAGKHMDRFVTRVKNLARRVFVFSLITRGFRSMVSWMSKVALTNNDATASVARLKGALLTMVQPLVNVIIPAFITFVNILTQVVTAIAKLLSTVFGTTLDSSRKAAESLYKETEALDATGDAAKKASKQLADFDELNVISSEDSSGSGSSSSSSIAPDFSAADTNWLKETLGQAAGWVTAALLLGGIALVAIGACTGSIKTVLAGLLLIGAGIYIGSETGVFQSWVDALGLSSVQEFTSIALMLGGIALIAIGAMKKNLSLVLAGMSILAAGYSYAEETGVLGHWKDMLALPEVAGWVTAALQLAGIALIAIGAITKNLAYILGGAAILAAGFSFGDESGAFDNWWDALCLPQVAGWVTTALLLAGMGFLVFGIITKNISMILGGVSILGAGINFGAESGTFQNWWDSLCLPQVAGWVTTALLLAGIGLLVIGIATGNLPMLLAGLGLLGTAITFGITSGTFSKWVDDIKTGLKSGWESIKNWWKSSVAPKLTLEYWKTQFNNIKEGLIQKIKDAVNGGIELFNKFIRWINDKLHFSWNSFSIFGKEIIPAGSIQLFTIPEIPKLASGAVIPPNREFMAVLGDQKQGTNIEAPLSTIKQALMEAMRENGGGQGQNINVYVDGKKLFEIVAGHSKEDIRRNGRYVILGE